MNTKPPTILYQFPLSHYCEKARWALDHKKMPYRKVNLVPVLHFLQVRLMAPRTTLPVLKCGGETVQDSVAILDYLDRRIPERPLTPADPETARQAAEWELRLDREVGVHLRRFLYFYLLPDTALAKRMIFQETGAGLRRAASLAFPAIRALMRKGMNIRPETAEKSRLRLERAFSLLNERLAGHSYLAGDCFSRADLSAAALLAPMVLPPEHDFPFPAPTELPQPVRDFFEEHREQPFFQWVLRIYREHRHG